MPNHAQQIYEGLAVVKTKARFTGNFVLEDLEADAAALDEVLVCAVVARVRGSANDLSASGEHVNSRRLEISDVRVVTDRELRDAIVSQCGLYGADLQPTLFDALGAPDPDDEEADGEAEEDPRVLSEAAPVLSEQARQAQALLGRIDDDHDDNDDEDRVLVGNIRSQPSPDKDLASFLEG